MSDPVDVQEGSFRSNGVPIRFVEAGEGVPVVFVHGLFGSAEMWTGIAFEPGYRTIALDCRGHGLSGKPSGPDAYGVSMITDVVNLLDELQIDEAHVVGYSMGAEIVLKLATMHPERVRSLVVAGSGWSGAADAANYQLLADSLRSGSGMGLALESWNPGISAEEIEIANGMLDGQDVDALANVTAAMGDIVNLSSAEVAAIAAPVLAMAGEHDPERANLEKMEGVVPDLTMRVIEGRDHMSASRDARFKTLLYEFLARQ